MQVLFENIFLPIFSQPLPLFLPSIDFFKDDICFYTVSQNKHNCDKNTS